MNTDKKVRNRAFEIFLYGAGVIIITIMLLFCGSFGREYRLTAILVYILIIAVLIIAEKKASEMLFGVLHNIAFVLLGTGMALILHDDAVFFCVLIMQLVISLLILGSSALKKQIWLILFCMTAYGIADYYIFLNMTSPGAYIICSIAVIGIHWLCSMITLGNERHEKISSEFERSQDELIRIIEAKCDEAREATRSKSEFLSNMSHEIRTPLNSILGMNELILRECTDDNVKEYATVSDSSGRLLLSLINDILDFSKIESGKMEIVPVKYHISALILDNVRMLEQRFEDKGLTLVVDVDRNIPDLLVGDEMRIRQILTNLMSNALKYTDKGMVTLKVSYTVPEMGDILLRISVKDTGKGITEEDKKKLFKNFSRVDLKNNRNIEGTGLGLAITSRLVDAMHGTICVESTYGEGSDFTVVIPQGTADDRTVGDFQKLLEQKRADSVKKYHESFTAPDAKILVVDDTPSNLRVVKGLLKRTQIQIDTADSGAECLELLGKNHYDILFLDHMMPEMDGVETLGIIKRDNLAVGTPIVALTANAIPGCAEKYAACGFDAYLSKPVLGSALEELLIKLLPKNKVNLSANKPAKQTEIKKQPTAKPEPVQTKTDATVIDKELGMMYCGGMTDLYAEMLSTYLEQAQELRKKLEAAFTAKDWDNYRITSHTVKSTSLTIGAKAMSQEALTHEMAAKNNEIDTIENSYAQFTADIAAVIESADKMLREMESKS